jgi:hypothetical protein
MGWQVMLGKFPSEAKNVSEVQTPLGLLGRRETVLSKIERAFPNVRDIEPERAEIDSDDFLLELWFGTNDPTDHVIVTLRGSDRAVEAVCRLAELLGTRIYDISSGKIFEASEGEGLGRGFKSFKAWAARVT